MDGGIRADHRDLRCRRRALISASLGTSNGGLARALLKSTCAYMPGSSAPSAFGTWTSTSMVRLPGSSEFAVRATVPLKVRPGKIGNAQQRRLAGADGTGVGLRDIDVGAQRPVCAMR